MSGLTSRQAKMNSSSLEVPPRTDVLERKGLCEGDPKDASAFGGRKGLGMASNCTHPWPPGMCSRGTLMLWTARRPPPTPRRLSLVWSSAARRGWVGLRRSSLDHSQGSFAETPSTSSGCSEAAQGRESPPPRSSSEFTSVHSHTHTHGRKPPPSSPSGSRRTGCSSLCGKAASPRRRLFSVLLPGPDRRETVAVGSTLRALLHPTSAAGCRGWPGVPAKLPFPRSS